MFLNIYWGSAPPAHNQEPPLRSAIKINYKKIASRFANYALYK
jgi:hypothetical protein